MASQVVTPVIGDHAAPLKDGKVSGEPVLDQEGNIIPNSDSKSHPTKDKYWFFGRKNQMSPIARLAAAADLKKPVPTAGQYAIEHSKEPQPDLAIPPECFLYDEDRPWVLGKLNPDALDLPEPAEPVKLSPKVLARLDALEAAALAVWKKNNGLDEGISAEKKEGDVETVDEKINAALKHATKPKSRTGSVSPAAKGVVTPRGRSSTSPAPQAGRPKTPKSRGVSPKIVSSSGPKKVVNAK